MDRNPSTCLNKGKVTRSEVSGQREQLPPLNFFEPPLSCTFYPTVSLRFNFLYGHLKNWRNKLQVISPTPGAVEHARCFDALTAIGHARKLLTFSLSDLRDTAPRYSLQTQTSNQTDQQPTTLHAFTHQIKVYKQQYKPIKNIHMHLGYKFSSLVLRSRYFDPFPVTIIVSLLCLNSITKSAAPL